ADTLGGGDGSDTIDGGAGNDVIEGDRTGPSQALGDTLEYSYAQNSTGGQAAHFGEQGTGGVDDPLNFIDGDIDTESRYHVDDIIEYSFGQEVPAGTSITLIEGPNGVDDGIVNVYVSFGSTDINGDSLSSGGGGVGYENAITNGDAVLIYSGPSDSTIDLEIPINATHIQFVGIESHGGWAEIEFTELMNPLDPGDDVITGGDGDDIIDGGGGNDTIDGGADNDTILGGIGDDSLSGGSGSDNIDGGEGTDQIDGGTGDDDLDGGLGDDTVLGGDGADTITGGESTSEIPLERVAFEWSAIPDPNDGGQIDNLDAVTTGSQTVGSTTVDFSVTGGAGQYETTTVYTNGIDAGGGAVGANSALGLDGSDGVVTLDFSNAVENVQFRVNDFEANSETLTIRAYDADGNLISFSVAEGSGINGSDTDGVAGNDTFQGPLSNTGDNSPIGSVLVTIPGPVARIELDYTQTNGGLTVTDVWFDEPGTGIAATGNDLLEGGADEDTFVVLDGFGQDTIIGGETVTTGMNYDTIDLSGVTVPLTVTYDGDKSGTITDGTNTITFSEIERLILGPNADVVNATADGAGIEIIAGGGDDVVEGGTGNDIVDGGDGNDAITGGTGNDALDGGSGDDTLYGGDGDDTLTAGNNTGAGDFLYGGAGNDTLNDSFWNATLDGGDDADLFNLGYGDATVIGGEGGDDLDTISFANADDAVDITLNGNESGIYSDDDGDSGTFTEIEAFELTSQNDSFDGSVASSSITVEGGAGNDTLIGGSGNDSIDGGAGDDTLTGGAGNDVFVYTGGSDIIADFNTGNTGTINDGDATNNDSIDLSGRYDTLFELWADQADDGILNQSNTTDTKGNAVDYSDNTEFAPGEGITFTNATADRNSFNFDNTGVVCFTPGTLILTETGERPIETLRPGDRIVTRDNGVQVLQWVACRELGHTDLKQAPRLRPIWIAPDLVGASAPLLVSPQHGLLLRTNTNDRFLVRATHLERLRGGKARTAKGCRQVTYIHLMFDAHQIIFANGAATESFYPGPMALKALSQPAKDEQLAIFPELFQQSAEAIYGDRVRTFARFKQLPEHQVELRAA
ncbi:MAG: Hint domain-containing protein, partial [Octadecabacter sp.]|nr:Hint domain-containing protein [Octadecabacter sp.]